MTNYEDISFRELMQALAKETAEFVEANIREILVALLVVSAAVILISVILIVANWRIYEKAGEHGWWSLIPVLGGHVAYKIAWHPFFFWLNSACLLGVEVLNYMQLDGGVSMPYIAVTTVVLWIGSLVLSIVYNVRLSKVFGHGIGFAVGLIFLPIIFIPILAFGRSEYEGKWGI